MTKNDKAPLLAPFLERIATALEGLAPQTRKKPNLSRFDAYVWQAENATFSAVERVNLVDLSLLKGIERQRDILLGNTRRFSQGFPANNALLWGARGAGKSSLVKAVHAEIIKDHPKSLVLVEIHREDISSLPLLLDLIRREKRLFILFCDDLSFDGQDASYKSLKAALEGGIEGRPENLLFYATSNRRHLMARDMIENERSSAINPDEAVNEKVSLSDRFGLWLGFHNCDQETYLEIVKGYAKHFAIDHPNIDTEALEWAVLRGARSGRVAWQYIQDLAGKLEKKL
jgi:uncharacterized protein